jgi:hypothetical protein
MQPDSHALVKVVGKDVIAEMASICVLMRTRLVSRVITGIYDEKLRPLGIGAAHFALLVVIYQTEPATRAEIGRTLMVTIGLCLLATGVVCIAFEALGIATAFFGIAVLLLRFA